MPRTVAEGFKDFLASLTPSSLESSASMSHRASIEACLKNNFVLNRLFRTGSTGNGTSISGSSDVYYCARGWMRSSPDAHNDYVRSIDNKHTGKVKPLIRFIKAWKFFKQVPISSFYLELRVAKYADGETDIIYAYDVQRLFDMLYRNNL